MFDLLTWMMVFLRASAMLSIFPVFSTSNIPVQLRIALGALLAYLIAPGLPPAAVATGSLFALVMQMLMEIATGLLLGFVGRMLFYALDAAGAIVSAEIGLTLPTVMNPMGEASATAPGIILNYLAALLWLSLDFHHWMLASWQQTYQILPIGGAHLHTSLLNDLIARSSQLLVVSVLMTAPLIAVSFVISLVFAVLGRAVPQMNVFSESFAIRILAGLTVFGLSLQLMAQHMLNYLRRLPDDLLRVAQLLSGS